MGTSPSDRSTHGGHRLCLLLLSLCVLMLLPSCIFAQAGAYYATRYDSDISDKEELWGEYASGQVYETTMDLFIMDVKNYSYGPGLTIGTGQSGPPRRGFDYKAYVTVDKYRENPDEYPEVLGLLDRGSYIRIEDLRAHGILVNKSLTFRYVRAEVLTGEHKGLLVTLTNMTKLVRNEKGGKNIVGPLDYFLTLIEDGASKTDSNVQVE